MGETFPEVMTTATYSGPPQVAEHHIELAGGDFG